MTRIVRPALAATAVLATLVLTACSSGTPGASGDQTATTAPTQSTACATSPAAGGSPAAAGGAPAAAGGSPAAAGGSPAAAPGGANPAAGAAIPIAKTIKPTDNSTSIVYTATGPEITCGRTGLTMHSDVVYATPTASGGQKITLKLDIQTPDTTGTKPLVIYLTGGGFVQADKQGNLDQRTWIAEQGYAVASIEYRTVTNGHATYKDAVADVKSAIRYLRAHADEYGIDPANVAVWGQSAGGYLAGMTGATNGEKQFDAGDNLDRSSDVQAVVDEFGPSDLSKLAADYDTATQNANYIPGNSAAQWVYGQGTKKSIKDDTPAIQAADPATHVSAKTPPFIELHGSQDHLVSPSQTLIVHDALRAKGIESTRYVLVGADHGDLSFTGNTTAAKPWNTQETMTHILDFLNRHL